MRSARAPMLALAAGIAVAASSKGRADTIAAPFNPPAHLDADVPPRVSAAVVALREACATWKPAAVPATLDAAGSVPKPMPAPAHAAERTLCEVAHDPDQAFLSPMILGGVAGAILFFLGLVVFSLLRGVLISVWNWRLPIGGKSW